MRLSRITTPISGERMEVQRGGVAPRMVKGMRGCDRSRVSGVALLGLGHFLLDQLMGKGGVEG